MYLDNNIIATLNTIFDKKVIERSLYLLVTRQYLFLNRRKLKPNLMFLGINTLCLLR